MNKEKLLTMPLAKVIAYLESVGVKHITREGRFCIWAVTPQFPNHRGLFDIRDLALELFNLSLTESQNQTTEDTMNHTQSEYKEKYLHVGASRAASRATLTTVEPESPVLHTTIVKIISDNGTGEIVTYSDPVVIERGVTFNSRDLLGKAIGSTWLCEIRVTGKGSRKIESIQRFDKSVAAIHEITESPEPDATEPVATEEIAPVAPVTTEPEPNATIESVAMPLTKDVRAWSEPDYYISPDAKLIFATAYAMLKTDSAKSVKILMTGESGYGKTTIAEKFAAFVGFDCLRVNCATIRDTEEWFLDREVVEQNGASVTKFIRSEFANKIAAGNIVVILDEFNRLEPNLHNSLFPLLDDSGKTRLHHIDFTVGHNVIFVATVNLGYKFVGTFALDDALMNRFEFVLEVSSMPFDQEIAVLESRHKIDPDIAESIVKLATTLRDNEISCSTRDTLRVAKMVQSGLSVRDAFEYAVIRRIPNDDTGAPLRKSIVDLVNSQLGTRDLAFAALS